MKKLLILLSIFFLISNSNIKPAGRSDDAAAVAESKKEKEEAAAVGRYPSFSVKDNKVMKAIASAYPHIPAGISGLILDYCKSRFECGYILDRNDNGHTDLINSLIKLDKTHFVSGSGDGTIKIWRFIPAAEGKPEKYECLHTLDRNNNGHNIFVCSLILLDATHFISCSREIKIWEYDSSTGNAPKCIHTLDRNNDGHTDWINSIIAFDATHFISCSNDWTIKIWQYDSLTDSIPRCIYTLDHANGGHNNTVRKLIKIDETHFASGSDERIIKIWEFVPKSGNSPRCIFNLDTQSCGVSELIKIDESHFISSFQDRTIKIWKFNFSTGKAPECIYTQRGHDVKTLKKLDEKHFFSSYFNRKTAAELTLWEFVPSTDTAPAACTSSQTLFNGESTARSIITMPNGDLIAGLANGEILIFKPVVDIK